MYETLLFLHVLGAFVAFVTIVMFSAYALGATADRGSFVLADATWNVSGFLLVVFGIWLALYVDGYELWDGWILGALVVFGAASYFGVRARMEVMGGLDAEGASARQVTMWHWLRTASVVAILVLMVWKPGA